MRFTVSHERYNISKEEKVFQIFPLPSAKELHSISGKCTVLSLITFIDMTNTRRKCFEVTSEHRSRKLCLKECTLLTRNAWSSVPLDTFVMCRVGFVNPTNPFSSDSNV
ncbi:hypothetical protein V1478_004273 [Vespula squamosa]|uniref:Uncharacterized protein n=1 Tax=Vespula squamosa TaxID=30214 RepID=A0ABD2BHI0_VESSQ